MTLGSFVVTVKHYSSFIKLYKMMRMARSIGEELERVIMAEITEILLRDNPVAEVIYIFVSRTVMKG